MPSFISDFEYDIHISCCYPDYRRSWVTGFVKSLKDELAATLKVLLSIYFDSHPLDGLLETYDVDGPVYFDKNPRDVLHQVLGNTPRR